MPSNLEPGFRLGKYEVLAHIASGGMGTVYKAMDLELRRLVALKVLPTHLAQRGQTLERFRREARHAARLSHPHIVTLYECGYDAGRDLHYLALEFIEGIDLGAYIQRQGRLAPEEARRILIQATRALEHAFEQSVIHRDIKPSNFLLARVGNKIVVKLTDLGLARVVDEEEFKVTRDGSTVGTIDYISPEQARDSQAADVRSDIYSLGCTAYHMLAGRAPFADGGIGERVYKHMEVPPEDVREFNPRVSEGFWAILWKMLAKKPEDRYATPTDLLNALKSTPAEESAAPSAPVPPRRRKTDDQPSAPSATGDHSLAGDHPPRQPRPTPVPADAAALVTPEQKQAAVAFHERAVQVLAEGGGVDYARQLLTNCLKLDPFTPAYRKTLREMNRQATGSTLGRWLGSLSVLTLKAKMHSARATGDWRKVLEHGEEVLARHPADADTHREMSQAAAEMDLFNLAMWLLEQGHAQTPDNADLLRAMAQLHEQREEWLQALALWEQIQQLEPDDPDTRQMINDLTIKNHLAKGHYRR